VKIAQIVRRFVFSEWGGTETVVWNTSLQLNKLGHQNEILSTSALQDMGAETVNQIPLKRFPYFYPYLNLTEEKNLLLDKKGGNPYSPKLYKYLCRKKDIDIFHCHTMQRLANTVRRAALKLNKPYVVSFHGGYYQVPEEELTEMLKPLKGTLNYGRIFDLFLQNKRFLADCNGIICVGYNEYLTAREKYPDKQVIYLPNGVDIDKFELQEENDFRNSYNIAGSDRVMICVSRIDYQKNQLLLLKLLKTLKEKKEKCHLVLVGPVTAPAYFKEMREFIAEHGLENDLTIIPGLKADDPELVKAFLAADLFILPSVHEPFGIVALEAWSAGLPVIASRVGGLSHLIEDKRTGLLFESNSLDDLLEKYQLLSSNEELEKSIKETAYNTVREKYSWQIVTEQLLEFYQKVLKR